jgi:membrane protein
VDNGERRDDASLGELMQRLSQQTATLVRQEIRLAQVEMQHKGKQAGLGAGMFGGAALFALGGFGALIAGLVLALAESMETWGAALVVAGGLFVIAALMALFGKKEVSEAIPPKPERTMESVQADLAEVKERMARA